DDFAGGIDKHVYAENTSEFSDIFVRIKLQEFMDLKSWADRDPAPSDWTTHTPGTSVENCGLSNQLLEKFHANFVWGMGGSTYFVPNEPGTSGTVNHLDVTVDTPGAEQTLDAVVIPMAAYKALDSAEKKAFFGWVYDTDGWAYWSQPLMPGQATGMLLESVTADSALDESDYFYAINVIMEAVDRADLPMWTVASGNNDGLGQASVVDPTKHNELGTNDAAALLNTISIVENSIVSIEITTEPNKTSYAPGEAFDPTGMVIQVNFSNGDHEFLTEGFNYSPAGALAEGTTEVSIFYGGFVTTVTIDVSALEAIGGLEANDKIVINGIEWVVANSTMVSGEKYVMLLASKTVGHSAFGVSGHTDYEGSILQSVVTDYYINNIMDSPLGQIAVVPTITKIKNGSFDDYVCEPTSELALGSGKTVNIALILGLSDTKKLLQENLTANESYWTCMSAGATNVYFVTATGGLSNVAATQSNMGYRPAIWVKAPTA
ncbi:MAG: bacterial Ig-like domain-containing protein, partial [Coriobacteriales bacterium]|nr:bacterial Ig-like domain-containing protein [Coriobacteriales bacterium]